MDAQAMINGLAAQLVETTIERDQARAAYAELDKRLKKIEAEVDRSGRTTLRVMDARLLTPGPITTATTSLVRVSLRRVVDGAPVDLSALDVVFAFVEPTDENAEPSGDGVAGSWDTDASEAEPVYVGQIPVGGEDGQVLAVGRWQVWVKVAFEDEAPWVNAGMITVVGS